MQQWCSPAIPGCLLQQHGCASLTASMRHRSISRRVSPPASCQPAAACLCVQTDARAASEEVLSALRRIIDPDFGEDIVSCGFVKSLNIDPASGAVSFTLELTTPACPVKDQFKREATQYVQVSRGASSRLVAVLSPAWQQADGNGSSSEAGGRQ